MIKTGLLGRQPAAEPLMFVAIFEGFSVPQAV
jgi:hypothetical protein